MGASCFYYNLQSLQGDWVSTKTKIITSTVITLVMIYNSLVEPYFDYCSIVWNSLGKGLGQTLQRLQNIGLQKLLLNLIITSGHQIF